MDIFQILFWVLLFIVFYTYLGYGLLLGVLVGLKRIFTPKQPPVINESELPEVTLFIAAYNEADQVHLKMQNSLQLDYPKDQLKILWVTDGSDDGTDRILRENYPDVMVLHEVARNGKIGAINRGMQFVNTPIVIFSDANTMLSKEAIRRIVAKFADPKVGCVSGEKRIINKSSDTASGAGEGIYWKYESLLKRWDAALYSVVGAAGELFAIRTALFEPVEKDTLLDDFIISLRIAQKGYTIQYDPLAYAEETASANVNEELKRKVRIAAGGIQSVIRLKSLLNIFKYGTLSFQYISHRVLRWTLTPVCLLLLLPVGFYLAYREGLWNFGLYSTLFWLQVMFYLFALVGWLLAQKSIKLKVLFVPYYFFIMNLAVFMGLRRYLQNKQTVNWERAKRATLT